LNQAASGLADGRIINWICADREERSKLQILHHFDGTTSSRNLDHLASLTRPERPSGRHNAVLPPTVGSPRRGHSAALGTAGWIESSPATGTPSAPVIKHGRGGAGVHRVVDRNGTDFNTYRGKATDPTIPLPGALADLFDVAERVSIVIRAAFSRIDLYGIRGRIVFGEVTPCPGSSGGSDPTSTS
jgi:hypothetical protein